MSAVGSSAIRGASRWLAAREPAGASASTAVSMVLSAARAKKSFRFTLLLLLVAAIRVVRSAPWLASAIDLSLLSLPVFRQCGGRPALRRASAGHLRQCGGRPAHWQALCIDAYGPG